MSNADKILCPVEPRGEYAPHGHCLYHVAPMQHTSASLCGLHRQARPHAGSRVHTCAQVYVHKSTRGSSLGMCRLGPGSSLALPLSPAHLPRVPGARWGRMAWKPLPAAVPSFREATRWRPAHRACLPLHLSPELPGRPQEAQPPAPHAWVHRPHPHNAGGAAHFLPHFQKPSQSEAEENRAEQSLQVESRHLHMTLGGVPVPTRISAHSGCSQAQGFCTANN